MTTTLRKLPRGAYTVRWRALSFDGHVVSGVWTFGVRVAAPPPTEAYGASGPTRTEHVVRWAYFLALALLIGGLGFRLLLLRGPLPPARRVALLQADRASASSPCSRSASSRSCCVPRTRCSCRSGDFLYGDLSPIASGTRFGTAFIAMTLGFALVAALRLPRVAARAARAALAGLRRSRSASRRGSRSRATRPPTPERRGSPSSPTGCTSRRRASGSAASCSSRSSSGRSRPRCGATRSSATRGSRRC